MNQDFWKSVDQLINTSECIVERSKGSIHPQYSQLVYPLDYGYLADTASMDGSGIDFWRGSLDTDHVDALICTVDLVKRDSEIKLLIGCTEEEKKIVMAFHSQTDNMKGLRIDRR